MSFGSKYPAPYSSNTFNVSNFPSKAAVKSTTTSDVSTTNLHLSGSLVVDGNTELTNLMVLGSMEVDGQINAPSGVLSTAAQSSSYQLMNKAYADSRYVVSAASSSIICDTLTAYTSISGTTANLTSFSVGTGANTVTSSIGNMVASGTISAGNLTTSNSVPTGTDVINKSYADLTYLTAIPSSISCSSLTASGTITANGGLTVTGISALANAGASSLNVTGTTSLIGLASCGSISATGTISSTAGFSCSNSAVSGNDLINKTYGDAHYNGTIGTSGTLSVATLNVSGTGTFANSVVHSSVPNSLTIFREAPTPAYYGNNLNFILGPTQNIPNNCVGDIWAGYPGTDLTHSVVAFDAKPLSGPNGGGSYTDCPFWFTQAGIVSVKPLKLNYAGIVANTVPTIASDNTITSSGITTPELNTLSGVNTLVPLSTQLSNKMPFQRHSIFVTYTGVSEVLLLNNLDVEYGAFRVTWFTISSDSWVTTWIRRTSLGWSEQNAIDGFAIVPVASYLYVVPVTEFGITINKLYVHINDPGTYSGQSTLQVMGPA